MFKLGNMFVVSMLLACIVLVSAHAAPAPNEKVKPCDCITPAVYFPVCGSDKITYGNKFMLECENKCKNKNIKIAHTGKC